MTGFEPAASRAASAAPEQPKTAADAPSAIDAAMSRYADGDDSAFAPVFQALAPRIQAFLRRLCGSRELASDLTQETFLRMHRARGSFAEGRGVVPWAYAIARNCYVSQARSHKFKAGRSSVDISEHEMIAGAASSAEETAMAQQSARVVEKTLAQMSVVNREAFILIRFEGQSVADAAQILGTTEGAVKLRAFRAYEALRAALEVAESGASAGSRSRQRST